MKKLVLYAFLIFGFFIGCTSLSQSVYASNNTTVVASEVVEDANEKATEEEQFDWGQWFKDKCLPVLIAAGTSIVTICTCLYPVLNTLNGGVKLFKGSKDNYEAVTKQVLETQKEILEFKENALSKIEQIKEQMQEEVSKIAESSKENIGKIKDDMQHTFEAFSVDLQNLLKQVENQIKVLKIAFGNNTELVKNGYANEILKIGVEDGSKEVKEENNSDANS